MLIYLGEFGSLTDKFPLEDQNSKNRDSISYKYRIDKIEEYSQ